MCVEVTSMIVTHQLMSLIDKQQDYYKMNVCKLGEKQIWHTAIIELLQGTTDTVTMCGVF